MAQFDEEKVINALHPEKAEVGKKYWYSDSLTELKCDVEISSLNILSLMSVEEGLDKPFISSCMNRYQFLYPYEEPPKQRMTNRQLAEWLAKGNGQYTTGGTIYHSINYNNCDNADEHILKGGYKIRSWGSEEWIEPTVDIYERDCKKE